MQFDSNTPRRKVTIQETSFEVPTPFTEGYTLSENEASALNQLLIENVRNNFAAKIKKAEEAKTAIPTQAELDAYVEGYEFGERSGGGRTSDPVEREAMEIAREKVRQALQKKGHKIADVKAATITQLAQDALEKYPSIREQAKAVVAARQAAGAEELDIAV